MSVEPPRLRHSVEDFGDKLRITIPSRKQWVGIVFLTVWLLGMTAAGLAVIGALLIEKDLAAVLLFLCIGVFLSATATVIQLLWQLSGKEVIEVTPQSMTLQRQVLGLGLPQEFPAEHIRSLRTVSNDYLPMGVIAFDCGARAVRIGSSIDEAEGKQILATIQQRFPQYQSNRRID